MDRTRLSGWSVPVVASACDLAHNIGFGPVDGIRRKESGEHNIRTSVNQTGGARPHGWSLAAVLFGLGLVAMGAAYHGTAVSFYDVWRGSETYTHCFFVLPIAGFLAWRRRDELRRLAPEPFLPGLLLIAASGALWVVSHAAGVLFYEQLAFALLVPALVVTIFGLRIARVLTFPLAFLLLAVPFGEALHPALMSFTARAAVAGLRLTGVPVAVEGMYLTTPTGKWQVVEACSGLRFLISMFTLGCLFAYLHFRRPRNRILFGILALIVPVLANGVRAYVMVLTGYLSRTDIGSGFNHFAIGWTVFAVVMAVFFYLGSRWREDPPPPPPSESQARPEEARPRPIGSIAAAATAAIALALAPAALSAWTRPAAEAAPIALTTPRPLGGWAPIRTPPSSWSHGYRGAEAEVRGVYEKDGALVECYIGFYRNQAQGRELIHFANVIVPRGDARWRIVAERDTTLATARGPFSIHETDVRSPSLGYAVWHVFWLPDEFTVSRTLAKLLQARARLLGRHDHAAVLILSSPYADRPDRARRRLVDFTEAMLPAIHEAIREADASR
jgi:exosortase A